jgi:hypothetical protein
MTAGLLVGYRLDTSDGKRVHVCGSCARRKAGGADALDRLLGADVAGEVYAHDCDDVEPGETLECDACGFVLYRAPDHDWSGGAMCAACGADEAGSFASAPCMPENAS